MDDVITTAPVLDLTPEDLATVLGELASSHQLYRPLLQRREQRENAVLYLRGVLSRLARQAVEPMVMQLVGVAFHSHRKRRMARLIQREYILAIVLRPPTHTAVRQELGRQHRLLVQCLCLLHELLPA